jgi:two-component system sensor histidine kinase VicK
LVSVVRSEREVSSASSNSEPSDIAPTVLEIMSRAKLHYSSCFESKGATGGTSEEREAFRAALQDMRRRGVNLRAITEITRENLEACKRIAAIFELRHLDGVKANFAVTDLEYIASPSESDLIYSNSKNMVEQQEYVFETLWNRAVPAREKIQALELGREAEVTEFLGDRESAVRKILALLSNAKEKIDGIGNSDAPNLIVKFAPYWNALLVATKRVARKRYITDITSENVSSCKKMTRELGVEIRHLQGVKSNIVISESEFASDLSRPHPDIPTTRLLYSTVKELLDQQNELFETLWSKAIPAEARYNQIEKGVEPEETRLITDMQETIKLGRKMTEECQDEALVILASESTIERNKALFQYLAERQAERGFRIRVLAPFSTGRESLTEIFRSPSAKVEWRRIEPINVSFFIYDRRKMFITQHANLDAQDSEQAVSANIYSTNKQTIAGIVSVFEALWRETELRESEELTRLREQRISREARLLQDILAHDIRNFNQVARLSAEMLKEELKDGRPETTLMLDSMLRAIDGSTQLVERAKKLGLILSHPQARLRAVNLTRAIDESLSLVKGANMEKKVVEVRQEMEPSAARVMADDFLTEVFANIFTNSVRYTDGDTVPIYISVEEDTSRSIGQENSNEDPKKGEQQQERDFWKISISDEGRGIPDEIKGNIFTRYLENAKGSGLGMSIVYALVVERYGGKVRIEDRVKGDYMKGTTVHVWLRRAR